MTHCRYCKPFEPYIIDGIKIERVRASPTFKLIVYFTFGKILVQAQCYMPSHVRAAHDQVARNPKVIKRIEMHDHEGCIDTIWDNTWS